MLGPKTASHDHIRNVYTSYESPNRVNCRKTEVGCILEDIIGSPFCLDIVKAHAHRPIFKGIIAKSAVESADSILESADSTTDFTIVGRLSISNMFNISTPTQSADSSRSTIAVGGLEIGLVGMGLYFHKYNKKTDRNKYI